VKLLFYGRLAETIDRQIEVHAPQGCSIAELRRRLAKDYPSDAETLGRSRAFVANRFVPEDHVVSNACEVELLPPVSGG
jgi:molybdopterin converting factor small subunit